MGWLEDKIYLRYLYLRYFLSGFLSIFFNLIPGQLFALEVYDDNNTSVQLNKPAMRIVSLAPDITEILFALHAGNQIVGVMQGSDYPPLAKNILVVGTYTGLDIEKILSLHPDLIVTWGDFFTRQLQLVKEVGVAVYVVKPHHLLDVAHTMKQLGTLTGHAADGARMAAHFTMTLQQITTKSHQNKPKVFYQIGGDALFTINHDSWINDAITLCGGENIFASARFISPKVSMEALLAANPDVIISDATDPDWIKPFRAWPNLKAVQMNHFYTISPDLIDRAGPRLLQGVKAICEAVNH